MKKVLQTRYNMPHEKKNILIQIQETLKVIILQIQDTVYCDTFLKSIAIQDSF